MWMCLRKKNKEKIKESSLDFGNFLIIHGNSIKKIVQRRGTNDWVIPLEYNYSFNTHTHWLTHTRTRTFTHKHTHTHTQPHPFSYSHIKCNWSKNIFKNKLFYWTRYEMDQKPSINIIAIPNYRSAISQLIPFGLSLTMLCISIGKL